MKLKYLTCLLLVIFIAGPQSYGQSDTAGTYTFLLTGASFATKVNGWFELGCELLNAGGINRAKGGTAIADVANQMIKGALYSQKELEDIDALVIMHVVNKDVYDTTQLKEAYTDYETPFDRSNYAAAYDYVIRRYLTECYNLKFNKNSRYYESSNGKPAVIVLCTDWHEGRNKYNKSIRKLASKWGFPLVEFDKNIGFSQEVLHPVTGKHIGMIYAKDTQTINGEAFGWHPKRGRDKYIQKRMAAIFADKMRSVFLVR